MLPCSLECVRRFRRRQEVRDALSFFDEYDTGMLNLEQFRSLITQIGDRPLDESEFARAGIGATQRREGRRRRRRRRLRGGKNRLEARKGIGTGLRKEAGARRLHVGPRLVLLVEGERDAVTVGTRKFRRNSVGCEGKGGG